MEYIQHYEEALEAYDKAVELDPNFKEGWRQRGLLLFQLQRYEEALESCDKAIELDPNFKGAWEQRGWALFQLQCYEQALESWDKVIEIDPNDALAWILRSLVLKQLQRYEEALASAQKAINLGAACYPSLQIRAISLMALNRWNEGITSLEKAFNSLEEGEKADVEDTEIILRNLFTSTTDATIWKTRITTLLELFYKYQFTSVFAQGLVRSIPIIMSDMVSDKAAQTLLEIWQKFTENRLDFQIALRLVNAAVRYKITKKDRRVLLELPKEERSLLEELLEKGNRG